MNRPHAASPRREKPRHVPFAPHLVLLLLGLAGWGCDAVDEPGAADTNTNLTGRDAGGDDDVDDTAADDTSADDTAADDTDADDTDADDTDADDTDPDDTAADDTAADDDAADDDAADDTAADDTAADDDTADDTAADDTAADDDTGVDVSCEEVACLRPYTCAESCDGPVVYSGCCECESGLIDTTIECPKEDRVACGARAGDTCSDEQYCAYEDGEYCGAADAEAVCKARPFACTREFVPVCGCDGKTYNNACEAASKGSGVLHLGECSED